MRDDKTVPMGDNPWADHGNDYGNNYGNEDDKRTVVDGNDKTVPMDGGGYQRTPGAGSWERTEVDDNAPFQPTNPQDRPTPRPGGLGDYPRYESPPSYTPPSPQPQRPAGPAGGEGKTQIMPAGVPETMPLAWLAVVEGPGGQRGQVFRLGPDTVLGRTGNNHIPLSGDRAVSSRHLKIKLEESEEDPEQKVFVLYDQGSSNGTFVGSYEACKAAENRVYRQVLEDGDFLLIGETILVFKAVDEV